jgi:uncharacterized protein (DUF1499 family)
MDLLHLLSILLVVAVVLVLVAGQAGLLRRPMADDLGLREGRVDRLQERSAGGGSARLPAGAGARQARIDPIRFAGDGADALTRIGAIVLKMPGARILQSGPDYLYVQFESRWLRLVDDAEFAVDPAASLIHVRSSLRLGWTDFSSRARIESIRAAFDAAALPQ